MTSVSPYMYEPTKQNLQENEEPNSNAGNRLAGDVLDWCRCGQCENMVLEAECYCCCESEAFNRLRGDEDCITFHDSFDFLVLNIDSLKTAKYHMSLRGDAIKRKLLEKEKNSTWRHVAYTQFIYWVNAWIPFKAKESDA